MANPAEPVYRRFKNSVTNVGTGDEQALDFRADVNDNEGLPGTIWLLASVHFIRTGGTGANYQLRMGQAAGWTDGDIDEKVTYASAVVANIIKDVYIQGVPFALDANAQVHFRPGFDAGADNDYNYEFYFIKVKGGVPV
jgi:hypothetical protein